ncbi:MAG: hypothetical protein QXI89_00825 [Candidatus Anstonellales archaeon]
MQEMHEINNLLIYKKLKRFYGSRHDWWPWGNSIFMPVSAILTQATSWKNVEKAVRNLKSNNLDSIVKLLSIGEKKLAELIKPAGFYRQKAKRLRALLQLLHKHKRITRKKLLSLNGIGKETADSILLYYFNRPYFVIDAYTKRFHKRLTGKDEKEYDKLASIYGKGLSVRQMKEMHALIVEHSKHVCKKKPDCMACPLKDICHYFIYEKRA